MTAGAGALNVVLGGDAIYHGQTKAKPQFGCGAAPNTQDIERSLQLIDRTLFIWCAVITMVGFMGFLWL